MNRNFPLIERRHPQVLSTDGLDGRQFDRFDETGESVTLLHTTHTLMNGLSNFALKRTLMVQIEKSQKVKNLKTTRSSLA